MKTGNQEPTFKRVTTYSHTLGDDVAEMFAEDGGATFYPCQIEELRLMLARNSDGSPSGTSIGITKPRQNGKSYSARYYAIYMADFEHRSVLYSAHHSSTTKKMFDAMCDVIDSPERYPHFANDVKNITRGRGYEGIYFKDWKDPSGEWHKGGCIEFSTRTNSGARGGTYSVVIIDEAQELTNDQQEALLPVASAASNVANRGEMPQQIYLGTPPSPTCKGTVFRKLHDQAHSTDQYDGWWIEWSTESLDDINRDKVIELAYMSNPAMGYRISEETIMTEYEGMSIDGFARERLGWWSPIASRTVDYALDKEKWSACASDEPKPEGKTAYGIKFSADGSEVVLCGAVIASDGNARISMIERANTGQGLRWLSDWLNERYTKASCVVVDGRNGTDLLIDRIRGTWKVKDSIIKPSAKDVIASTSELIDAVNEQRLTWYRLQDDLNDSATTAIKRGICGGFGFGGENSLPIEACALALWGAKTSKRNPNKKMRIG